jgi:hypothetical protein
VFYQLPARDRSVLFGRRARKIARIKNVEICLLGRIIRTASWAVLVIGVLVTGALAGHWLIIGPAAAALTLGWFAWSIRFGPPVPAGGGGFWGEDFDEGGAGVREPRRPLPDLPGGTIALPLPHEPG